MLFLWLNIRLWLWRKLSIPLPAKAGWQAPVVQVAQTGIYQDAQFFGAPLAWCLMDANLQPVSATCAISGVAISSDTPLVEGAADVTHYGVRCARCGIPIHFRHSGMKTFLNVPSCPPCRRVVRRVMEQA